MSIARGLAAAVLSLSLLGTAWAEPGAVSVALDWTSREGCIDSAALATGVAPLLRRHRLSARDAADAVVRGSAAREPGGGWQVELIVLDSSGSELGERELSIRAGGCDVLRDHVFLVAAMLVDSSVVAESARRPPAKEDGRDPATALRAPVEKPPGRRAPPRAARWRFEIALGAVAEAGRLPETPPGGHAVVAVVAPRGWRAELHGAAFAPAEAVAGEGASRLSWRSLAALGCPPRWRSGRVAAGLCAGIEAGAIWAEGSGFLVNRDRRELLVDARGELRGDLALTGTLFVRAAASGRAALRRPRFGYQNAAGDFVSLYTPAILGFTGRIGVGLRFP